MELPSDIKIKSKRILIDFSKQRKLSDDSVFEGLCDETKTPAIAFIVEKSGIMDRSAIGLKTKFLASISARYLKNSGKNIKLIDIADLKNFDLSPTKYPILVISDLTGMRFKKYIEKYVDDGGKIIIMGGKTADFFKTFTVWSNNNFHFNNFGIVLFKFPIVSFFAFTSNKREKEKANRNQ